MQRRRRLEQQLGAANSTGPKLTTADVKTLVASLKDIVATLADADPADKAAVYRELGISLTYNNDGRVVVEARPRVVEVRVGGRIATNATQQRCAAHRCQSRDRY